MTHAIISSLPFWPCANRGHHWHGGIEELSLAFGACFLDLYMRLGWDGDRRLSRCGRICSIGVPNLHKLRLGERGVSVDYQ